jgi:hypothetical protein
MSLVICELFDAEQLIADAGKCRAAWGIKYLSLATIDTYFINNLMIASRVSI